ncbi:DUF6461 domain-containing protein [Streptomyces sp. NPDC020681]|uniref:DUF6461 domain-containing protein n=1 Tax=Streptomyces sp. NPDC020681 TaxID=3365083 RepID=UPI0037B55D11
MTTHSSVTAEDFAWLKEVDYLGLTYGMTLVQGITPAEALRRLGAETVRTVTGLGGVGEACYEAYDRQQMAYGVRSVDDWVLIFEPAGTLANDGRLISLSEGTTVVSQLKYMNGSFFFSWWENSKERVEIHVDATTEESGLPDDVIEAMRAVGIPLTEEEEDAVFDGFDWDSSDDYYTRASFALAERITGLSLSLDIIEGDYLYGAVPR